MSLLQKLAVAIAILLGLAVAGCDKIGGLDPRQIDNPAHDGPPPFQS